MARQQRDAVAILLCAALSCGAAQTEVGEAQEQRGTGRADEAAVDARLLADLEILRDLELLRQLDVLRKVEQMRSAPGPRTPPDEKGKP